MIASIKDIELRRQQIAQEAERLIATGKPEDEQRAEELLAEYDQVETQRKGASDSLKARIKGLAEQRSVTAADTITASKAEERNTLRAWTQGVLDGEQRSIEIVASGTEWYAGKNVTVDPRLVVSLKQSNVMRSLASVTAFAGEGTVVRLSTRATAYRVAEAAAITETDPATAKVTFSPVGYGAFSMASRQAIALSANSFEADLMAEHGIAIGTLMESDYCTGSGSGQPLGVFTSGAWTTDVDLATAGTLTYAGLADFFYESVGTAYHGSASWLMHASTFSAVMQLVDSNGRPLIESGGGPAVLASGAAGMLFGRPVYLSPGAPSFASTSGLNLIACGDFSAGYRIADWGGVTMSTDPNTRVEYGQIRFVSHTMSDGHPVDLSAVSTLGNA